MHKHTSRLLPVVISFAMSVGMIVAPSQELMIMLACLSNPPASESSLFLVTQESQQDRPRVHGGGLSPIELARLVWNYGTDSPTAAPQTQDQSFARNYYDWPKRDTESGNWTPAEKWMMDVQRSVAADRALQSYQLPHQHAFDHSDLGLTVGRVNATIDLEPTPMFVPVDPSLCKRDPNTQAAAATLTMSE